MKGKGFFGFLSYFASGIVLLGALTWGFIGIGHLMSVNLNIVNLLLGSTPELEAVVYIIVGVCATLLIFLHLFFSSSCCDHFCTKDLCCAHQCKTGENPDS